MIIDMPEDMQLYELGINGNRQYTPCPKCKGDMSYFASINKLLIRCNFCKHIIRDKEADIYMLKIWNNTNVRRRPTNLDGYIIVPDFYSGD